MNWEREAAFDRLRADNPRRRASGSDAGQDPAAPAMEATPEEESDPTGAAPSVVTLDEPGQETTRAPQAGAGRRSATGIVAAAALALGLVVGGYVLGSSTGPPPTTQDPITLYGPGGEWAGQGSLGPGDDAEEYRPPVWDTRTTFAAVSELSTSTGTAEAWSLEAPEELGEERLAAMATVLGIDGDPRPQNSGWTVRADGHILDLSPGAGGRISYRTPERGPSASCEGEGCPDMAPGIEDEAVSAARALLDRLGLSAGEHHWSVQGGSGDSTVNVRAGLVVQGHRTGLGWTFWVDNGEVVQFGGTWVSPTSLGDYPVVSEEQALERLMDPRFGAFSGDQSTANPPPPFASWFSDRGAPSGAERLDAGDTLRWPVRHVTVTEARLGLGLFHLADGQSVLLPAYEFTDTEGRPWSVIAVADDRLDFASED